MVTFSPLPLYLRGWSCLVPGEEETRWDTASLDVLENCISVNQTAIPRSFRSTLVSQTHMIFLLVIITVAAPTLNLLVLVPVLITLGAWGGVVVKALRY